MEKKEPTKRRLKGQQVIPEMVESIGYESIDLLSPEHERFCYHYATYGNGRAAYQYAYPRCSAVSARAEAPRILAIPSVIKRLDEIRKEMSAREADKVQQVINYHSAVLTLDLLELVAEDGSVRELREIPLEVLSILDMDIQLIKGRMVPSLKVPERKGAAGELARILGIYKDKLQLSHDTANMTDEQIREELKKLAADVLQDDPEQAAAL